MASNVRRGKVPYPPTGVGEYVDEVYSLKGFFGEWAHMWRRHNLAHPLSWSDERLIYNGLDSASLAPADRVDPRGVPLTLLRGPGVSVSLSGRSAAMPFCEKNVDRHQIRFYHAGAFTLETELGVLDVEPGDFVVIPRNLSYRETPQAPDGNYVYIFETEATIQLAETLWDSVGFASLSVDYSAMVLPEPYPEESDAPDTPDGAYELRLFYDGVWHSMTYAFDPCRDVVGWIGDPVIFKLSAHDIPAAGTSHGHLTPPSGAVLWGEDRDFFFNVIGVPPTPNVPPPDGSNGAPSHLNDYDELWLVHVFELMPQIEGHLWLLPRTVPHPGLKLPARPPRPDRPMPRSIRINFDTKAPLTWTPEARAALFENPILEQYTSFFGLPPKLIPPEIRERYGAGAGSAARVEPISE